MGRANPGVVVSTDVLSQILERKRVEVTRRLRHACAHPGAVPCADRAAVCYARLGRRGAVLPHVIAEIKHRSPSAGVIRERVIGGVAELARGYERGGAAAVSVLCDRLGFGGGALDVRRAAAVLSVPVLFKEFVLHEAQVDLAQAVGASMVLLLVRALDAPRLDALIDKVHACGLAPVVEAADDAELDVALRTQARIVGVNARDLRSFHVDGGVAARLVDRIPPDRIAVYMSGIRSRADLLALASHRADAVLVGEGLMRHAAPGDELARWLAAP